VVFSIREASRDIHSLAAHGILFCRGHGSR
jgi:hypothetical protein